MAEGPQSGQRIEEYARDAGVRDTLAFESCVASSRATNAVVNDELAAKRIGALGTPTLLIGNELYVGRPAGLDAIIERHLAAVAGSR